MSLDGFRFTLIPQDYILKEILFIESLVQFVESFFYSNIIRGLDDIKQMTPRRYFDWMITTPIMLFSTIIFLRYNRLKEDNNLEGFTIVNFTKIIKKIYGK